MMWFSLQQLVGVSWTGWPIVCGCSDVEWGEWHAQTVRAMEGLGNANNATRGPSKLDRSSRETPGKIGEFPTISYNVSRIEFSV